MLVYDGDCGMCTRLARWARRRLPPSTVVTSWQAIDDLGRLGLTPHDVETAAYWVERGPFGSTLRRGERAVGHALVAMGGLWRAAGWAILSPPLSWLSPLVYRFVARNRHRFPGGSAACRVDRGSRRR